MTSMTSDKRLQARRHLEQVVAFYANGNWDLKKYAMGQTRDVSTKGVCIRTNRDHMPEPDSLLILMLIPENQASAFHSDTVIRIKGRVVWTDRKTRCFGVCFT